MKCRPESRSYSSQVAPREPDSVDDILQQALAQLISGDFNTQWQAAKSLKVMGESAHPALMKIAEDTTTDPDVLCFISEILGANPSPDAILALVLLLKRTTSEEVQDSVIMTLAKQGPSCVEQLLPYAEQPSLQKSVLKALIQINHPTTIAGLMFFAEHKDSDLRAIALEGLGQFHSPEILELLLEGLQDRSAMVRANCTKALGLRLTHEVSEDLVQGLLPLLNDPDPKVRSLTAKALGRVNQDSAIEGLWQCLLNQPELSLFCSDLLQALGWARHPKGVQYLLKLLCSSHAGESNSLQFDWTTGLLIELIQVLGSIHQPDYAANIEQALTPLVMSSSFPFDQFEVKQRLIMAIAHLKQETSIDSLIQALAISEERFRFHLIAALKGINAEKCHEQLIAKSQDSTLDAELADGIEFALKEW